MPDEPSIVDYKADGSVRLVVTPQPIRLGRPTVGRLRQLREDMVAISDEISDRAEDHNEGLAERAETAGVDLDEQIPKEFKRAERDLTRDLNRAFDAMRVRACSSKASIPFVSCSLVEGGSAVFGYIGLISFRNRAGSMTRPSLSQCW